MPLIEGKEVKTSEERVTIGGIIEKKDTEAAVEVNIGTEVATPGAGAEMTGWTCAENWTSNTAQAREGAAAEMSSKIQGVSPSLKITRGREVGVETN